MAVMQEGEREAANEQAGAHPLTITTEHQNGEPLYISSQSDPGNLTPTANLLATKSGDARPGKPSSKSSSSSRHGSAEKLTRSFEAENSGSSVTSLGPQDSFTSQFFASAAKLKNTILKTEPVSFKEIAHSPALSKRARAEMESHRLKGVLEGNLASRRPHDMEVARLQVSLDAVENDAEEECKNCLQMAHLIIQRLDSCRRAIERLLGILQAVSTAEAAYNRAMNAVSKVKLSSNSDSPALRTALLQFSDIPWNVAERHSGIANGMVEVTKRCQDSVRDMRRECETVAQESRQTHQAVLSARKNLHTAFSNHRNACNAADDASLQHEKNSWTVPGKIEIDPWISEGRVVSVQASLLKSQAAQRDSLLHGFQRAKFFEEHRIEMLKDLVHSFLHSYRAEFGGNEKQEKILLQSVDELDPVADLDELSKQINSHEQICKEVSERQDQALQAASQDLLCSPDIVRQGLMARWITGTGKWADCHFVLTRSGFLHWLADAESYTPLGGLNLSKCQFEAGEAPKFHIIEVSTGFFSKAKRQMFQAPSVEECCEWAIAIRESIAARKP